VSSISFCIRIMLFVLLGLKLQRGGSSETITVGSKLSQVSWALRMGLWS
jgi:hypothetical protein